MRLATFAILAGVFASLAAASSGTTHRASGASCFPGKGVAAVTPHSPYVYARKSRRPLHGKKNLRAGWRVRTSHGGGAKVCLKQKKTECNALTSVKLNVQPKPSVLMRLTRGYVACVTESKEAEVTVVRTATGVTVRLVDPLFGVRVRPKLKTTVVKVVSGFVEVRTKQGSVIVGKGQQTTVQANNKPPDPVPLQFAGREAGRTNSLKPNVPPPDYAPPAATNSPTLKRIYSEAAIDVAVDNESSTSKLQKLDVLFTARYFDLLAENWKIRRAFASMPPAEGANALCTGQIDAYVTPAPDAVDAGAWRLPFLEDPRGEVWYLVGMDDNVFRLALRSFLIQTLEGNAYGDIYRATLKQLPRYSIFAPLLKSPGEAGTPICIS